MYTYILGIRRHIILYMTYTIVIVVRVMSDVEDEKLGGEEKMINR